MSASVSDKTDNCFGSCDRNLPRPLRGIIPPMVTPLSDRDTLDHAGLERLIEHMISGGIHGLFILGTTGEGPSLSYRLRCELIERTCAQVAGRIPVLVAVTDTAFVESVNLANHAAEAGAAAAVFSAPYYFPAGQPELLEYVTHLVEEMPLPVFLYNMPSLTKTTFGLELLAEAVQMPQIVGLKDSSGDLDYFRQAVAVAKPPSGFLRADRSRGEAHRGDPGRRSRWGLWRGELASPKCSSISTTPLPPTTPPGPPTSRPTSSARATSFTGSVVTAHRLSRASSAGCRAWGSVTIFWRSPFIGSRRRKGSGWRGVLRELGMIPSNG